MSEVFDLESAGEYLHLAKTTIYKYVKMGAIPGFKVGRVWRFKKEVLDEWMRKQSEAHATASAKKHGKK